MFKFWVEAFHSTLKLKIARYARNIHLQGLLQTTPPASENQKKNKKDKKKSESEKVVEEPVQAEAPKSKKPTADDNMDFLDFVTAKEEPKDEPAETPAAPVEEVVENVVENVVEKV